MDFVKRLTVLCLDGIDAIKKNLGKFLSFFAFALIGIVTGIWYGTVVVGETVFFWHFQDRIMLVILGQMPFIKYLFFLCLECILLVGIILVLSLNYYASFLSYLVFVYKGYLIAFNAVIIVATAKFSCLPFILLCYLPISLIILFFFACIALKAASDSYYAFSTRCRCSVGETLRSVTPLLLIVAVLCILETILTFLFTPGMII